MGPNIFAIQSIISDNYDNMILIFEAKLWYREGG